LSYTPDHNAPHVPALLREPTQRRITLNHGDRYPQNPNREARERNQQKASQALAGHDAVLNAIQKSGRTVFVETHDNVHVGKVIARDAYTITVECITYFPAHTRMDPQTGQRVQVEPSNMIVPRVFYKSQILSFWAEPKEA
jgi:hypothetical protein